MAVDSNDLTPEQVGDEPPKETRQTTQYTDEFKALALALVDSKGGEGHVLATSKQLGIPNTTLAQWHRGRINPAVTRLRNVKKTDLAEGLALLAGKSTALLNDNMSYENSSTREIAGVMGMAVDKLQLLTGEATQRTEHTDRGIYSNLSPPEDVEEAVIVEETDE